MKLKDAREYYYFYSGKTSDIVRQLSLGGIALIWLFKAEKGGFEVIPQRLLLAALWLVAALALDFFQYIVGTGAWGWLSRKKEKAGATEAAEFTAPDWINRPAITFFVLKIIAMCIAYEILIKFLLNQVHGA